MSESPADLGKSPFDLGKSPAELGTSDSSRTIARSIAELHKHQFGKGPDRAKCYLHDDCVLVLMYEGHTRSEETLQEGGEQKAVARQRVRSSDAIHDELVSVVENVTKRQVIGYMSSSQQEPSLLAYVFVLATPDLLDLG